MPLRRPLAVLLAGFAAVGCTGVAAARTPVRPAPVRQPALHGLLTSQWTTWWGTPTFAGGAVTLTSRPPLSPAETHSALITTKRAWGDATISFTTTTLQQLRRGSAPNPWEVGWVLFRFRDPENYYWFMLKTNGFELGKKQGSDTQIFLATGPLPALTVGRPRAVEVRAAGARIRVFVDGAKLVDYTDTHPLLDAGSVGLYEEDSQVLFNALAISS